jgi:hypothetical protein
MTPRQQRLRTLQAARDRRKWQRRKENKACCVVEVDCKGIDLLIRARWLAEADAHDPKAIGQAISAMLRASS